jgi:hypothetical protein
MGIPLHALSCQRIPGHLGPKLGPSRSLSVTVAEAARDPRPSPPMFLFVPPRLPTSRREHAKAGAGG